LNIDYIQGEKVPPRVWGAVILGLVGSLLVAFDGTITHNPNAGVCVGDLSNTEELKGILFIVASCICYSLATIRLGLYGEGLLIIMHGLNQSIS
jgi:drug/metabolite transporter (DMT)-like permease